MRGIRLLGEGGIRGRGQARRKRMKVIKKGKRSIPGPLSMGQKSSLKVREGGERGDYSL